MQTPRRYQPGYQRSPHQRSTQLRTSANRPCPTALQPRLWALHQRDITRYQKSPHFVSPSLSKMIRTNYLRCRTTLPIGMVARSCMTRHSKKVPGGPTRMRARGLLKVANIMGVRQATLTPRLTGGSLTLPRRPGVHTRVVAGSPSLRDVPLPSMGATITRKYTGGMRRFAQPTPALAAASYPPYSPTGFTTLNTRSFQ